MSNKTQSQRFYWGVGRFYLTPAPSYATACKHARNASKQSTDDYNVYVEFASGSGLEMITSYNRGKINYKSPRFTRVGCYIMDNYNGTPCEFIIGYYWDKGGYDKSFLVIDNVNKKQYVFGRIYNPNEWADIRACECWVLDETIKKIVGADVMKYKSIRDGKGWGLVPIARLVHSDDLGQKYKRNYPVICEWMPEWNAHTGANWNATK